MDVSDPQIVFDHFGVCNHCYNYYEQAKRNLRSPKELDVTMERLRERRANHEYDALLGVSGGCDSSKVALLAYQYGLKVLLTHFDNEMDDPRAGRNIERIVDETGWDYEPCSMDLEEYFGIWKAYLRASVIDIEVPTDHAIVASMYETARKHGIKIILNGYNVATESIIPRSWTYRKNDLANLKDIVRQFGNGVELQTLPTASSLKLGWLALSRGIKRFSPLNYLPYSREEAKDELAEAFGWEDYGPKHWESILTRFYQAHILPTKFGVDKRKAHLSNMILSHQMTREQALRELGEPVYPSDLFERDSKLVLSRLELAEEEFDKLMSQPPRSHADFASNEKLYSMMNTFRRWLSI